MVKILTAGAQSIFEIITAGNRNLAKPQYCVVNRVQVRAVEAILTVAYEFYLNNFSSYVNGVIRTQRDIVIT